MNDLSPRDQAVIIILAVLGAVVAVGTLMALFGPRFFS